MHRGAGFVRNVHRVLDKTALREVLTGRIGLGDSGRIQTNRLIANIACVVDINLLKPTGYVMHQQFNIQQLYALPTLYLCVLCLSENKQRLVPLTA